jgi:hypothetical protein
MSLYLYPTSRVDLYVKVVCLVQCTMAQDLHMDMVCCLLIHPVADKTMVYVHSCVLAVAANIAVCVVSDMSLSSVVIFVVYIN